VRLGEGERWTRLSQGKVVHSDSEEHVALITRTLGIDASIWSRVLDGYAARVSASSNVDAKLGALGEAFGAIVPPSVNREVATSPRCDCCGEPLMQPALTRRAGEMDLVYGRCAGCGHGQLLSGAASAPYAAPDYYRARGEDGSGYAAYLTERPYREAKGAQLFDWLESVGVRGRAMLEVGCGFGYTRSAAEARGLKSAGVDVNPEAARAAHALYGLDTHVSTLGDALASGALASGAWDIVLYQFVLEHLADPRAELTHAARALSAQGHLVLVVPSMSTFELSVFGSSYRSLRGDHLHLFSERSLRRYLSDARLTMVRLRSHCSLQLLRGFLAPVELDQLYESGRGPDFTVLAKKDRT
jgi:SAM-dependent methyltransferase